MFKDEIQVGVAKGCLAGLGLSMIFVVVGALVFVVARAVSLSVEISLGLGIAGGPVLTTTIALGVFLLRSQRRIAQQGLQNSDETTARYDA